MLSKDCQQVGGGMATMTMALPCLEHIVFSGAMHQSFMGCTLIPLPLGSALFDIGMKAIIAEVASSHSAFYIGFHEIS